MRTHVILVGILAICIFGLVVSAPAVAQINVDINIGLPLPPAIVVAAPPQLVVIPGMAVSYAPSLPYNYFSYGGKYYVFHDGAWFVAPAYRGPWTFVAVERVPKPLIRVPVTYYKVPPGQLKKGGPPPWAGGDGKGHGKGHKHDD